MTGTDGTDSAASLASSHWARHAQQWAHIKPPLRPSTADLAQVRAVIARHYWGDGDSAALLFGVTPELAALTFPPGMKLWAFDQSQPMITALWPGDTAQRAARVGNWFSLDLPDDSIGLALGDGCLSTLDYPTGYQHFAASLARVLEPEGLFLIRAFCRPHSAEHPDEVFDALLGGTIGNFHVFKWRLAMALQGDDPARGVVLGSIWDAFQARVPDARALAEQTGFPLNEVLTIDSYRGSSAAYSYSSVAEVVTALGARFELLQEWRGDYELAGRCPQLLFRKR